MTLDEMQALCNYFKGREFGCYSAEKDLLKPADIIANESFCWALYDARDMRYLQSVEYYIYASTAMNLLPKLVKVAKAARKLAELGINGEHPPCLMNYLRDDLAELEQS